ncbi:uncharacterized protein LOC130692958 [Daphnia carinata]|uniref:uncharacterized protein LOC130692958 n=1 Tax=Daphnia carinata TaxID=120202 RepID=UPI00257DC168|nr:uncharacterized protein LOC130692958 [Daphnia carinata]
MFRFIQLLFVASMFFATLLEETNSFTLERVNGGDDHDHNDSCETSVDFGYRTVDDMDYEDVLEVEDTEVNGQIQDTSEENRLVKRNSFHAPGQRRISFNRHIQHKLESVEDYDEMPFQHPRTPTASHQGNHQLWDVSDEQQSWEVKDPSLRNLFGIRWDSAKNKKTTHRSSVEDSMEDLLRQQHERHSASRRSKRPSGIVF